VSATLRTTAPGVSVTDQKIVFTAGPTSLCTAATTATGTATCMLSPLGLATFPGTPTLAAATAKAGLVRVR